VIGLGESERDAHRAVEQLGDEFFFLLIVAEVAKHQDGWQIADNRAFVLQIVVQAEPLAARYSRMTAIARLVPSLPPYSLGNP